MSKLNQLFTKFSDVNLSDLNHELGKAKENLLCESEDYLGNFKTDANFVGTLIKNETSRLNEAYFDGRLKMPKLKKTISLPHMENISSIRNSSNLYPHALKESLQNDHEKEDLRRGSEHIDLHGNEMKMPRNESDLMQVCFIDEDDLKDYSQDDLDPSKFHFFTAEDEKTTKNSVKKSMKNAKETKMRNIHEKFRLALEKCRVNASKEVQSFKNKIDDENPVSKLMGLQKGNWDILELETDTRILKDIIKQINGKICEYNTELIDLLEEKDLLLQHREDTIADIKDLQTIL